MLIRILKKSQAAMEFLMTYGWAIMVVLVAIGALAYFGVLKPDKFLGNKCFLAAGLACTDYEVRDIIGPGGGEVYIVVKNSLGFDIETVSISASGCTGGASTNLLKNGGDPYTFTATGCTVTSGEKYNGQINITYTNSDSKLVHKNSGNLQARVGSGFI